MGATVDCVICGCRAVPIYLVPHCGWQQTAVLCTSESPAGPAEMPKGQCCLLLVAKCNLQHRVVVKLWARPPPSAHWMRGLLVHTRQMTGSRFEVGDLCREHSLCILRHACYRIMQQCCSCNYFVDDVCLAKRATGVMYMTTVLPASLLLRVCW